MDVAGTADRSAGKGSLGKARSHAAINHLAERAGASATDRTLVHALHNSFRLYSAWSAEHSIRVGLLVHGAFEALGHAARDAGRFGLCSCLHDIGKLAIPKDIIDKPDRLTGAERELVQTHTGAGENALDALTTDDRDIATDVIRHHHENMDGSGYPDGLAGTDLSLLSRIARICDFYDALTFDRPYRPGLDRNAVFAAMDDVRHFFDPDLYGFFKAEIASIDRIS